MPRTSNARESMIQTAVDLMRERGVEATSFSEVLSASGAPRGSIYHHFPAGKSQLIEEATRAAGAYLAAGDAFARWEKLLARALTNEGVPSARSRALATTVIAAVEGAVVLARAQRSLRPVDDVARELEAMVSAALDAAAAAG